MIKSYRHNYPRKTIRFDSIQFNEMLNYLNSVFLAFARNIFECSMRMAEAEKYCMFETLFAFSYKCVTNVYKQNKCWFKFGLIWMRSEMVSLIYVLLFLLFCFIICLFSPSTGNQNFLGKQKLKENPNVCMGFFLDLIAIGTQIHMHSNLQHQCLFWIFTWLFIYLKGLWVMGACKCASMAECLNARMAWLCVHVCVHMCMTSGHVRRIQYFRNLTFDLREYVMYDFEEFFPCQTHTFPNAAIRPAN